MDKEMQEKIDTCETLNTFQLAALMQELPSAWVPEYIDLYCEKHNLEDINSEKEDEIMLKVIGDIHDFVEKESAIIAKDFKKDTTDKEKLVAIIKGLDTKKLYEKI